MTWLRDNNTHLNGDNKMQKTFSHRVEAEIKIGMKVQIKPSEIEGRIHKGKEFVVKSLPRDLCGTEVVALENLDGSRFSAGYDLSMLEITDLN